MQQVQKYENGTNRIVAGRLHHFAQLVRVPVSAFLQDWRLALRPVDNLVPSSGADLVQSCIPRRRGIAQRLPGSNPC
jgi:transcriptional regulator with XRE-family HTH domain